MPGENKIKILILAANPEAAPMLDLDEEARGIDAKLLATALRDRFQIVKHGAVRLDDLAGLLLRHQPDIVHFSAHGQDSGDIVFVGKGGRAHRVAPVGLAGMLAQAGKLPRLVVFNGCYTAAQAKAAAGKIDFAVGVAGVIKDEHAIIFAPDFYQALGFGRSVQEAFDMGVARLVAEGLANAKELMQLHPRVGVQPSAAYLAAAVDRDVEVSIGSPDPLKKSATQKQPSGGPRKPEAISSAKAEGSSKEPQSKGSKPVSHSDVTYVVFCRIDGVKTLPSEEVAASVSVLHTVVDDALKRLHPGEPLPSQSSVYGRFVLAPGNAKLALDLAKQVLKEAARKGVTLAIGVACGRVERTLDLREHNVAGVVVNRSARLAHLPKGSGKIVVEPHVADDAIKTAAVYRNAFSEVEESQVKKTKLSFRWFSTDPTELGKLGKLRRTITSVAVHTVIYDIVGFSASDLADLRGLVEKLRQCVSEALRALGVSDPRTAEDRFWYAPAGDGGVIVFRIGSEAWTFAKGLRDQAKHSKLPIRIGIATGAVVALDGLPLGQGVFEADAISALPPKGEIAASGRFWNGFLQPAEKRGWTASPLESRDVPDIEVLLLSQGKSKRPPNGPEPDGQSKGKGKTSPTEPPPPKDDDQQSTYREKARLFVQEKLDSISHDSTSGIGLLRRVAIAIGVGGAQDHPKSLAKRITSRVTDSANRETMSRLNGLYLALCGERNYKHAEVIAACIDHLLPLYFSWKVITSAASQLKGGGIAIVEGAVSTMTGADIIMAVHDLGPTSFSAGEEEPRGRHGQPLPTSPIDAPSEDRDMLGILLHLNQKLNFSSDNGGSTASPKARVERLSKSLAGHLSTYKGQDGRSLYCVVAKEGSDDDWNYWRGIFARLKELVDSFLRLQKLDDRLVFIELDPDAPGSFEESALRQYLLRRYEADQKRSTT
jgi:class 3 adenylate cyclase